MNKKFTTFPSRLTLIILLASLFSGISRIAKADKYPPQAREDYMWGCMNQPLSIPITINTQKRELYCVCLFDYIQSNVTYENYQKYDKILRENPQAIDPQFIKLIEQGSLACFQRVFR